MSKAEKNKRKKQRYQANKASRLYGHDLSSWKQHTVYHFQKTINGKLVDWWPTTRKCMIENTVYRVMDESDIQAIAKAGNA